MLVIEQCQSTNDHSLQYYRNRSCTELLTSTHSSIIIEADSPETLSLSNHKFKSIQCSVCVQRCISSRALCFQDVSTAAKYSHYSVRLHVLLLYVLLVYIALMSFILSHDMSFQNVVPLTC